MPFFDHTARMSCLSKICLVLLKIYVRHQNLNLYFTSSLKKICEICTPLQLIKLLIFLCVNVKLHISSAFFIVFFDHVFVSWVFFNCPQVRNERGDAYYFLGFFHDPGLLIFRLLFFAKSFFPRFTFQRYQLTFYLNKSI